MMKKVKVIAILTALAMTICINPASALTQNVILSSVSENEHDTVLSSENVTITDKMIFAEKMGEKYAEALAQGKIVKRSTEEIDQLMAQHCFALLNADEEKAKECERMLEECGVYIYTLGENTNP